MGDQTCSTFCPSVPIELVLSMWFLISAVAESSNSVNDDTHLTNIEMADGWCEGICAVKGDQTYLLYFVSVFTQSPMWCLISAVADSSKSVNRQSSTDQLLCVYKINILHSVPEHKFSCCLLLAQYYFMISTNIILFM